MLENREIFCNDCHNIFKITYDDLKKKEGRFFVECPICGQIIYLRSSDEMNEWWNYKEDKLKEYWEQRAKETAKINVRRRRTPNPILEKLMKDYSPIKEDLGPVKPKKKTKIEHVKELQEILVQTCIDYINKHGLTDIWGVYFGADSLDVSSKYGEWTPATDSSITIEGLRKHNYLRENGEKWSDYERYEIGHYL